MVLSSTCKTVQISLRADLLSRGQCITYLCTLHEEQPKVLMESSRFCNILFILIMQQVQQQSSEASRGACLQKVCQLRQDGSSVANQQNVQNYDVPQDKVKDIYEQYSDNRQIWIKKKPVSILQKLKIMAPINHYHVFNFLDVLGVNERTLKDGMYEESLFKTIFYIKTVEKVQLRKNALIIFTKNVENYNSSIQYLIDRFRSFGETKFYELSNSIEKVYQLYSKTNFHHDLACSYESEPLSRFIQSMQDKIYMCKIAPNKILISRRLLEFMEEDPQLYGIKFCKYKTPLHEVISGKSYYSVLSKSIENLGLLCSFLQKQITLQQLQASAYMQFSDYLYAKQKKMYCRFGFSMPTPLISCLFVKEQLSQPMDCKFVTHVDLTQHKQMKREMTSHRYNETQILKHLIQIPDNHLANHRMRLAGYQSISDQQ